MSRMLRSGLTSIGPCAQSRSRAREHPPPRGTSPTHQQNIRGPASMTPAAGPVVDFTPADSKRMQAKLIPVDGGPPFTINRDVTVVGRSRELCDLTIAGGRISK